jgi:hypothetical protein
MKISWGIKVILIFIVFFLIVLTMVFISFSKKTDLVSNDYYSREIDYQNQINRINRTKQLSEQLDIKNTGENIIISFPLSFNLKEISGDIQLYNPADASKDIKIKLNPDDSGRQFIPLSKLPRGQWKIIINWKQNSTEYYTEQLIIKN